MNTAPSGGAAPGAAPPELVAKRFRGGTERAAAPEETLQRARAVAEKVGVTRIANLTGLDRVGVPVVAVHRPNSRSLAVSQGKGFTLLEAQVSGVMESIESYHAEHVSAGLLLGSWSEMRARHRVVDAAGLPRLSVSRFHVDLPLLWMVGDDLVAGAKTLVPYEMVHTDFRLPLPSGSGCFVMSSNGLASGNDLVEAMSHAVCELVERDANTLWHCGGAGHQHTRRVDLGSIDDERCRAVLSAFDRAALDVAVWETTTDVGICGFLCTVVERDDARPMSPVSGSGCHPRRRIALLRALTEAAQGRLTIISGARDDLSERSFDEQRARFRTTAARALFSGPPPVRSFHEAPDVDHATFEEDLAWELAGLARAGLEQVVAVNLTQPALGLPVVRVVIPGLETMSELDGYLAGRRARAQMARAGS